MSYSIQLTPLRGIISVKTTSIQTVLGRQWEPADTYSGIKFPSFIPRIQDSGKLFLDTSTSVAPGTDGNANFNNADLSLVTEISLNSDEIFRRSTWPFLVIHSLTTPTDFVVYKITSWVETAGSPDHHLITVTFVDGTASSLTGQDIILIQYDKDDVSPFVYMGTPTSPVTVTGSLKAMNSFLQTMSIDLKWYEMWDTFTLDVGKLHVGDLTATPQTGDVTVNIQISKDGVPRDSYAVVLKSKTTAEVANPFNFPA